MSQKFRIGGYGESEPLVVYKNRTVNIINPQKINGEILRIGVHSIIIQFEPKHLHTDNEYVWVIYYEENFDLIATLRIEKELDERGWAKVWYTPKGSGTSEISEIYIDDLTGDRIKRLVTNRVKAKLDTDRDEGEGWDKDDEELPPLQQWKSRMTQPLKDLHKRIQNNNGL
jgi:hypothetical protein